MFPPVQCSKSSYFTQWLISEYLNRINPQQSEPRPPDPPPSTSLSKDPQPHARSIARSFFTSQLKHKLDYNKNGTQSTDQITPKNIEFIQLLALNALEFTAPIYSFINKKTELNTKETSQPSTSYKCPTTRSFVQLSGHPGSFAPAGPNTVWKKMPPIDLNSHFRDESDDDASLIAVTVFEDNTEDPEECTAKQEKVLSRVHKLPITVLPNECQVYRTIVSDPLSKITAKYVTETVYNSQMFLELEDLLTNFSHEYPSIMDIKLGTRTFLESEVKNNTPRPDLYEKMISVDPDAATPEESRLKGVTKLKYMTFRENESSSCSLGFRVEGVKLGDSTGYTRSSQLTTNFKCLKEQSSISTVFLEFVKHSRPVIAQIISRLEHIREVLEHSDFFLTHEVIGSSLLFIHDDAQASIWMIDFAKTFPVADPLTHRSNWIMGNKEDGVLHGIDNIINIFKTI